MGSQSVVYGYIQCDVSADVANVAVLESYPFDEVYPFPRIFSLPRSGYQSSVISFGHVFKDLARDWDQWVSRFEDLLGRLAWTSAAVHFCDELSSEDHVLEYARDRFGSSGDRMLKWGRKLAPPGDTDLV